MKKFAIITFIACLFLAKGYGQSGLGRTDDMGRIAIAAIVPDEAGVPGAAQRTLQNRMMQVATMNGLGATQEAAQFVMVPMISIISQDVTPTAPPQVALNIELSLYIVDVYSQNIFSQVTVDLRGVDNNEERAYNHAINNIRPRQGQYRGFIERGKEKIIEYYNSECDRIISTAQALAGQQEYGEALFLLMSVPDVSRQCYHMSMDLSIDIYEQYANQKCQELLSAARAAWASKDLNEARNSLGQITPDMECYDQAVDLVEHITATVEAEGASAWDFKMQQYEDDIDMQRLKIEAGRDVARSWAHYGAARHFNWSWLYKN